MEIKIESFFVPLIERGSGDESYKHVAAVKGTEILVYGNNYRELFENLIRAGVNPYNRERHHIVQAFHD
ncbi:MAG: hypothetical protein J4428_05460 [Candidatus Aenigmarchaeota archaeon]|nr:hypothetical protein [Candidatus Aenigmarchaeota archaeon]